MKLKIKFGFNFKRFFSYFSYFSYAHTHKIQNSLQNSQDTLFFARSAIQHNVSNAIRFLKSCLLSAKSFQQMPWYLVLGPKASGKTQLIATSELPFLETSAFVQLTPDKMATQGSINWWFSSNAVLIDVPGYYLENAQKLTPARVSWLELLRQLRLKRLRRPINGIVIAWDTERLLEDSILDFTHTLKLRLQETLHRFKQRLPIYIVITKLDTLQGFAEYYDDLGKNERDQCCGLTFLLSAAINSHWTEIFSNEFDKLLINLHQRALWRTHQEQDLNKRKLILNFPHQLQALKKNLTQIIYVLSSLQPYMALRGIYFTSSPTKTDVQKNAYPNSLGKTIEKNFGLLPISVDPVNFIDPAYRHPKQLHHAFFIKHLFSQKIFPEARLAYEILAKTDAHRKNILRWGISGLSSILLLGFIWTLSHQYQQQTLHLNNAASALSDYKILALSYNIQNPPIEKLLPALTALQFAAQNAAQANLPWLLRFQLHRKVPLPELTQNMYIQELKKVFIPALRLQIATQLNNDTVTDSAQLYGLLKVYLMLGDKTHQDKIFLHDWFEKNWKNSLMQDSDFRKHLNFAIENALPDLPSDTILSQKIRAVLNALPYDLLSHAIFQNELIKTAPLIFTLDNKNKNNNLQSLILPKTSLSLFFTKKTAQIINTQINAVLFTAIKGNWVLGNKMPAPLTEDETENLKKALIHTYTQENKNAWQKFLTSIHMKTFTSLPSLSLALQELTSHRSPFIQLLDFIQTQYAYADVEFNINIDLQKTLTDLKKLEFYIHTLNNSKNPGESALLYAQLYTSKNPPDKFLQTFQAVITDAQKLPEPFKTGFLDIAHQVQYLIFQQAAQYTWQQWDLHFLPSCKSALKNHYPFDKKSSTETSLTDFVRFFQKKGIFDQFFLQYLSPFVDSTKAKWQWKNINGLSFSQNEARLAQFERAFIIRVLYFNQQNQLKAPFTLALKSNKKSFYHAYVWPLDTQHIELKTRQTNALFLSAQGNWSIFKLIDKADKFKAHSDGQQYDLIFNQKIDDDDYDDNQQQMIYLLKAALINPFLPGVINAFDCP